MMLEVLEKKILTSNPSLLQSKEQNL